MGWLSTLGTVGGSLFGPAGAAIGGAVGGAVEGNQEQKDIDAYNAGQAEAGKYSDLTGQKANYNYKKTGALDQAAMGGANGLMFSQSALGGKMGGLVPSAGASAGMANQMASINAGNLTNVGAGMSKEAMSGLPTGNMMPIGNPSYLRMQGGANPNQLMS